MLPQLYPRVRTCSRAGTACKTVVAAGARFELNGDRHYQFHNHRKDPQTSRKNSALELKEYENSLNVSSTEPPAILADMHTSNQCSSCISSSELNTQWLVPSDRDTSFKSMGNAPRTRESWMQTFTP
eukprot:scaffold4164_cov431-Prasinococcus_capsulatus_cf.AAC.4